MSGSLSSQNNIKRPKAQISIEFISGFSLFIMVISYIVYVSLTVFPAYYAQSDENAIREEGWTMSSELMHFLENGTRMSASSVDSLSGCRVYHYQDILPDDPLSRANYTFFKYLFGVDSSNDFRITVESSPVVMTGAARGKNMTGNFTFMGADYMVEVFNSTPARYDSIAVSDAGGLIAVTSEEGTVELGGHTLTVDRINSRGKFVIFGWSFIDCGKKVPMTAMSSKIRRFTTYDGWVTAVDVVYW